MASNVPVGLVRGDYSIYKYTPQIYKIVKFKSTEVPLRLPGTFAEAVHTGHKLDPSFSRARRVVLEKALCNPWEWFCTLTIDPKYYDRYDLPLFYKQFSQWLRDQRKCGGRFQYLLVPEKHKNGAWHLHGLFYDVPGLVRFSDGVPQRLIDGGFYDWPDYRKKFGFCSFGRIRSPTRSAFYVSKYITKELNNMVSDVGSKLYYCSQGLQRAEFHGEVFGHSDFLDEFLQQEYDFCYVGMTKVSNGLDWTFAFNLNGFLDPGPSDLQFFDLVDSAAPLFSGGGSFFDDMAVLQFDQLEFDL